MALPQPSPSTWTMRFKHGKTTVILHVDPLDSFSSIKSELLRCLRLTHPDGNLVPSKPIPDAPEDILLASPVDPTNYARGWTPLDMDVAFHENDQDAVKENQSNQRPGISKGKGKKSGGLEANPKSAGLSDACELAFRFSEKDSHGQDIEGENWDVVQLTYDDLTSSHAEGEEGMVSDLEV